jgi:hypothetical protein
MSFSKSLTGQCGSAHGLDLSPSRRAQRPFPGHPVRHRLVLNSVGCVHQEDWLWPPGDVKRRIQICDAVSSGTRCTMALEPALIFRQDQASELRVVTSELLRHEDRARACDAPRKEANDIRVREGGHAASRRWCHPGRDGRVDAQTGQRSFSWPRRKDCCAGKGSGRNVRHGHRRPGPSPGWRAGEAVG